MTGIVKLLPIESKASPKRTVKKVETRSARKRELKKENKKHKYLGMAGYNSNVDFQIDGFIIQINKDALDEIEESESDYEEPSVSIELQQASTLCSENLVQPESSSDNVQVASPVKPV